MKILQMANGYLGNRLYENLFAALERQGVSNLVYVPVNVSDPPAQVPEGVIVSHCFSTLDRALFFRKQKKLMADMERHYDLKDVDVIHAHTLFSAGYAAMKFKQKYGVPYIVAVRNTDVNVFFKYMIHLRNTGVQILRGAEKVIFLSPVYQKKVLKQYVPEKFRQEIENKSVVIPNGIASLFFEQKGQPRQLKPGQVRLIHVGEINSNKNPELTIQAMKLLQGSGIKAAFKAVGTIKEDKYREILAQPDVEHVERCGQEEVINHLRGADIFVMPSHTETFGLVYAEAMSQGLPVLYTLGEGFDGQFHEGTVGYAVSDKDPQDVADKILQILERYETISANAVAMVDKFRWDTIAEEYANIYTTIKGE